MPGYEKLTITNVLDGVDFALKVVPGAARQRIMGLLGDALKVAVCAAPEDGKANQAVAELLAAAVGVRAADVTIIAGRTNPRKRVRIAGITAAALRTRLEELAD